MLFSHDGQHIISPIPGSWTFVRCWLWWSSWIHVGWRRIGVLLLETPRERKKQVIWSRSSGMIHSGERCFGLESDFYSYYIFIDPPNIYRMKLHLQPLAIAANVTQAAFCCLDTVLLTFGFLIMQYQRMADEADHAASMAIISSLKKRWAAADQDIFIATVIINPFFRADPFARHPRFVIAGIIELLGRLYTRFFQEVPLYTFEAELRDYLTAMGQYSQLRATCLRHMAIAKDQVCSSSCPRRAQRSK